MICPKNNLTRAIFEIHLNYIIAKSKKSGKLGDHPLFYKN